MQNITNSVTTPPPTLKPITPEEACNEIKNNDWSSLSMPGYIPTSTSCPSGTSTCPPFCQYNPKDCITGIQAAVAAGVTRPPSAGGGKMSQSDIVNYCNNLANTNDAKQSCNEFIQQKDEIINFLVNDCGKSKSAATDLFNNELCECNCNRKNCADVKKKLSPGAIAGIVVGSIVFIIIILYILYKKGKLHLNLNFLHRKHFVTKINIKPKKIKKK